jgi:hypothetical protein
MDALSRHGGSVRTGTELPRSSRCDCSVRPAVKSSTANMGASSSRRNCKECRGKKTSSDPVADGIDGGSRRAEDGIGGEHAGSAPLVAATGHLRANRKLTALAGPPGTGATSSSETEPQGAATADWTAAERRSDAICRQDGDATRGDGRRRCPEWRLASCAMRGKATSWGEGN